MGKENDMEMMIQGLLPGHLSISPEGFWPGDCVFPKGTYIHLTGPSGSGKSTLLNILYGRTRNYEGKILYGGEAIDRFSLDRWSELRQKEMSFLFQELHLLPDLSGRENIAIKSRLNPQPPVLDLEIMIRRLGLQDLMEKETQTLSLGERQRLAILRCLMQPFSWLLLDEPFSHLDEENARQACELILEISQGLKAGIIMANHQPDAYFPYEKEVVL